MRQGERGRRFNALKKTTDTDGYVIRFLSCAFKYVCICVYKLCICHSNNKDINNENTHNATGFGRHTKQHNTNQVPVSLVLSLSVAPLTQNICLQSHFVRLKLQSVINQNGQKNKI